MRAVLDEAEVRHEALVAPRRAFVPMPDTRVIERPGWMQLLTPSMRAGGLNEVSSSQIPRTRVEAVVDATLGEYREHGIRFRWMVGPDAAPADLGRTLEARGLHRRDGFAVVGSTAEGPRAPDGVTLERVDATNVDEFSAVMAEGWSVPVARLDAYHRVVLADPGQRQRLWLARVEGRAVAGAAYFALPRSAYLMGGVVLPGFRGRGLYRALVAARMADARRRGLGLATSQAMGDTSFPILRGLGFRAVGPLSVFAG